MLKYKGAIRDSHGGVDGKVGARKGLHSCQGRAPLPFVRGKID